MKIHTSGTIEGSPAELAEYTKLMAKSPFKVMDPIPPKTTGTDIGKYPGSGTIFRKQITPLDHARVLLENGFVPVMYYTESN